MKQGTKAPSPARELRVYTNGTDTVIAYSESDAVDALVGGGHMAREASEWTDSFELVPADKRITINFQDGLPTDVDVSGLEPEPHEHNWLRVTTTAEDWVKRTGRGMLCSKEY